MELYYNDDDPNSPYNNGCERYRSIIDSVTLQPGTYFVMVEGFSSYEGSYEVTATCTPVSEAPSASPSASASPTSRPTSPPSSSPTSSPTSCLAAGTMCGYDGTFSDSMESCDMCCPIPVGVNEVVRDEGYIWDDVYCNCLPSNTICGID